jgi:hypothetical protein
MFVSRRVLPGMIARGEGRIINLVTGVAPFAYFSGYCAGKAALIRLSECLAAEARPHGIAVFPMGPGTVRTAMSEYSLNSPEGRQWLPWFKRIFDDGLDLPPERPAELAVRLASGRYDGLSGLTLNPRDDLDGILAHLEEVERDKLYSMRLRALPSPDASRIEVVRDAGAQALSPLPELRVERHLAAARERSSRFGPTPTRGRVGSCHRRARSGSRCRWSMRGPADEFPSQCAGEARLLSQRYFHRDRRSRSARLPSDLGSGLPLWRPRRHRRSRQIPARWNEHTRHAATTRFHRSSASGGA